MRLSVAGITRGSCPLPCAVCPVPSVLRHSRTHKNPGVYETGARVACILRDAPAPMPPPLTSAQARVLDYVTGVVVERGSFPSGPRIARNLGFRNPATVYEHLERLAARGYLSVSRSEGGGWRRYHLTDRARARAGTVWPRLGRVPAGPLTDLEADLDSVVAGVEDILPGARPGDYFLEVDGDSMEGAGLRPGMLLLMRPDAEPAPGEICAVWVDGEGGTLKRVWPEGPEVRLVPENPAYAERRVPLESVRIQGVLVAALDVRRFR